MALGNTSMKGGNAPSVHVTRNYDAFTAKAGKGKSGIKLIRCPECQARFDLAVSGKVPAIGIRHGTKQVAMSTNVVMIKQHYARKLRGTVDRSEENMASLREATSSDYEHIQCPKCKRVPVRCHEVDHGAISNSLPQSITVKGDRAQALKELRKQRKRDKKRAKVEQAKVSPEPKKPLTNKKGWFKVQARVDGIFGILEGEGCTLTAAKQQIAIAAGEQRFKSSWLWWTV